MMISMIIIETSNEIVLFFLLQWISLIFEFLRQKDVLYEYKNVNGKLSVTLYHYLRQFE